MIKLLWRFFLLVLLAAAFTWLANRPGVLSIVWMGYEISVPLIVAVMAALLAILVLWLLWSVIYRLWQSPAYFNTYRTRRKNHKAYQALTTGLIAASSGDALGAEKQALIARKTLKEEPLIRLLEAQAAQLLGDEATLHKTFTAMLASPQTEVLGLRGLFADARQKGDVAAATAYAEKALRLNPRLAWASTAVLQLQTLKADWAGAAQTLVQQSRSGLTSPQQAKWQEAAMLAAQALTLEDKDPDQALTLAMKAHRLDPTLVPAALVAARLYAAQNSPRKALKIIRSTWKHRHHPDLAQLASRVKPSDKPKQRYERVVDLVNSAVWTEESAYALARAAIDIQNWDQARLTLKDHLTNPQARFCVLMMQIEKANDNQTEAQNWLSRAVYAPRDPMWVSDGVASPNWVAVSPVTGDIVACQWKPPFQQSQADQPVLSLDQALTPSVPELAAPIIDVAKIEIVQNQPAPDDPGPRSPKD